MGWDVPLEGTGSFLFVIIGRISGWSGSEKNLEGQGWGWVRGSGMKCRGEGSRKDREWRKG